MAPRGEKHAGLTLAAAGAGIIGASVVFGLTTDSGAIDWIGIVTASAGVDHDRHGSVQDIPTRTDLTHHRAYQAGNFLLSDRHRTSLRAGCEGHLAHAGRTGYAPTLGDDRASGSLRKGRVTSGAGGCRGDIRSAPRGAPYRQGRRDTIARARRRRSRRKLPGRYHHPPTGR